MLYRYKLAVSLIPAKIGISIEDKLSKEKKVKALAGAGEVEKEISPGVIG